MSRVALLDMDRDRLRDAMRTAREWLESRQIERYGLVAAADHARDVLDDALKALPGPPSQEPR